MKENSMLISLIKRKIANANILITKSRERVYIANNNEPMRGLRPQVS